MFPSAGTKSFGRGKSFSLNLFQILNKYSEGTKKKVKASHCSSPTGLPYHFASKWENKQ